MQPRRSSVDDILQIFAGNGKDWDEHLAMGKSVIATRGGPALVAAGPVLKMTSQWGGGLVFCPGRVLLDYLAVFEVFGMCSVSPPPRVSDLLTSAQGPSSLARSLPYSPGTTRGGKIAMFARVAYSLRSRYSHELHGPFTEPASYHAISIEHIFGFSRAFVPLLAKACSSE